MSDRAQWQRIEAALDEILELPQSEWDAASARIAAGDANLLAEIKSLLAHTGSADPIFDRTLTVPPGPAGAHGLPAGMRIGPYRIMSLIGRGGMGEVYLAERADGQYQQQVALKLIRADLADQPERFHVERQTLAGLEHPGIARLLDGGTSDSGLPYMALELVHGVPITQWCRVNHSTLATRLNLFVAICDAVSHAHRSLVVHRDLKPANVLVTDEGQIKLLDFGIAKLLSDSPEVTRNVPMTPAYSAPEQLTGSAITTATDVYALGVLLFELLTGELPWPSNGVPFASAVRRILSESGPVPSRCAQKSTNSPVPAPILRGDLDAIVGKALRKEPLQRYPTANALREDVVSFLNHSPVSAREGARLYLIGRYMRRHRVLLASAALLVMAILAGLVATAWQARRATQAADRARQESRTSTAVKDFLIDIFKQSSLQNPAGADARNITAADLLDVGAERIGLELKDQPAVREELMDVLAGLNNDLGRTDRAHDLAAENLAELSARTPGGAGLQAARLETRLATTLVDQNQSPSAEAHLQAALSDLRHAGEADSSAAAAVHFQWGRAYYAGDKPHQLQGAQHLQTALDILRRKDANNRLQAEVLDMMVRYAKLEEHWPEAEHWLNELLSFETAQGLERNVFGIGEAKHTLGDFQAQIYHYADAEKNLREAIELLTRAAGPDHPSTADARSRLGEMLISVDRRPEALVLLTGALQAQMHTPQGVADATETRKTLASLEFSRGDWLQAEQLLRENLDQMRTQPDTALRSAVSALLLSAVLIEEGALRDARHFFDVGSDTYNRSVESNTRGYAWMLSRRGWLELAEGKAQDAAATFELIARAWPAIKGQLSIENVRAVLGLAGVDLAGGHPASAQQRLEELLQRPGDGASPPLPADLEAQTRRWLGESLNRLGHLQEAELQWQRALALRIALDAPDSPWLAQVRVGLARSLADTDGAAARLQLDLARAALHRNARLKRSYWTEFDEATLLISKIKTVKN